MEFDSTNLNEVLHWLIYSGGAAIAFNWFVSWVLEELAFWHNLASKVKTVIVLAGSLLISFGSFYLLQFPNVIDLIQPWFQVAAITIIGWLGSQVAYKFGGK